MSCKFVTSLDILVTKGTNLVANVTVLVAISSPVVLLLQDAFTLLLRIAIIVL